MVTTRIRFIVTSSINAKRRLTTQSAVPTASCLTRKRVSVTGRTKSTAQERKSLLKPVVWTISPTLNRPEMEKAEWQSSVWPKRTETTLTCSTVMFTTIATADLILSSTGPMVLSGDRTHLSLVHVIGQWQAVLEPVLTAVQNKCKIFLIANLFFCPGNT